MSFPKGFFWGGAVAANQVEGGMEMELAKVSSDAARFKKDSWK